jgi:hypothetical protein
MSWFSGAKGMDRRTEVLRMVSELRREGNGRRAQPRRLWLGQIFLKTSKMEECAVTNISRKNRKLKP